MSRPWGHNNTEYWPGGKVFRLDGTLPAGDIRGNKEPNFWMTMVEFHSIFHRIDYEK